MSESTTKGQLIIRDEEYPSGAKYRSVYAGSTRLGSYDLKDEGFKPWGCRKVLTNENAAQVKVIQSYVAARLGEAAKAAALYECFEMGDLK